MRTSAECQPERRAAAGLVPEEELWTGRYSLKAMVPTWAVAGLVAVGLVVLGAVLRKPGACTVIVPASLLLAVGVAALGFVRRFGMRYRLTTQRLIQEEGILARTTNRIQTIDIDDITVKQGARVLFMNSDSRVHEMDSDQHPEHSDCTELNTVGFLSPGQSRETGNLVTIRTCGFHDHQNPNNANLQGSITITPASPSTRVMFDMSKPRTW